MAENVVTRYDPHFHLGMRVMTLIWCSRGWQIWIRVRVFNATFNNISVTLRQSCFIGGGNQNTHRQTLSHNFVSSTSRLSGIRTYNDSGDTVIGTDCIKVVINPITIRSRPQQPLE